MGIKRRMLQQGSEEYADDDGLWTIEAYSALDDDNRVAPYGKIPVPWPFVPSRSSKAGEDLVDEMHKDIQGILAIFNITWRSIKCDALERFNMPWTKKDTVVVSCWDEGDVPRWTSAASHIYDRLRAPATRKGIGMFRVELRNNEHMLNLRSSAINSAPAEVIQLMENAQDAVLEVVDRLCYDLWSTITYVMRGNPNSTVQQWSPTVKVSMKPKSRFHFVALYNEVVRVLESAGAGDLDIEVKVEIVPGNFRLAISEEMQVAKPVYQTNLDVIPLNGASIGPGEAFQDAGSVGPWIRFRIREEPFRYAFLTCYHVIAPGAQRQRPRNDIHGIGHLEKPVSEDIRVDYPAPFDLQRNRERRLEMIAEGRDQDGLLQTQLDTMASYATEGYGVVKYASGRRVNESDRKMDWALVVPHNTNHYRKNKVASSDDLAGYLRIDDDFNRQYTLRGEELITQVATAQLDDFIVKMGRTTESTVGIFNKIRMNVSWAGENRMTTEAVALAVDGADLWVKPGDSGAMIHNCSGHWVGMVVGTDYNEVMFSTAQDIIDDVLQTTGVEIQLA